MYTDAMDAIHQHLILQTIPRKLTYTAELVPERTRSGELCAPPFLPPTYLYDFVGAGDEVQNKTI